MWPGILFLPPPTVWGRTGAGYVRRSQKERVFPRTRMASSRTCQDRTALAFRSSEAAEPWSALQPVVVNRQAPRQEVSSLKVVAFNAKGGRHFDGIRRCLTGSSLAGANVVLLCDADWSH